MLLILISPDFLVQSSNFLIPNFLAGSKLRSRPRKINEETVAVIRKCGGLGEPILKNAHSLSHEDLCPMGLLVPDQDFGEYVGCQGAFFKRELAGKIGHFVSYLFCFRTFL